MRLLFSCVNLFSIKGIIYLIMYLFQRYWIMPRDSESTQIPKHIYSLWHAKDLWLPFQRAGYHVITKPVALGIIIKLRPAQPHGNIP